MKKAIETTVITAMLTLICFMTTFAQDPNDQSPMNLGCRISSSSQITWDQKDFQRTCTLNNTGELLKNRWLVVYEKSGRYTVAESYHFDEDGIIQTGRLDDQGQAFYLKLDGRIVQGECVETIDEQDYVFGYQNFVLKNRNITIDGKSYNTDEDDRVISNIANRALENPFPSGQSDQLTYLNTYHRQKGVSDLSYDSGLTGVTRAAYDYGNSIVLSEVYSLASIAEHNIYHVAFIRTTTTNKENYVYLTEDAAVTVQNTWFTRVGYYKSSGTIMIIMTAYNQEGVSMFSADEVQDRWINDNERHEYRKTDGSYAADCWVKNPGDGKWCHSDEDSCMQIGWFQDSDGKWYYLSMDTGEVLTNTAIDGYVVGRDGVMVSGSWVSAAGANQGGAGS